MIFCAAVSGDWSGWRIWAFLPPILTRCFHKSAAPCHPTAAERPACQSVPAVNKTAGVHPRLPLPSKGEKHRLPSTSIFHGNPFISKKAILETIRALPTTIVYMAAATLVSTLMFHFTDNLINVSLVYTFGYHPQRQGHQLLRRGHHCLTLQRPFGLILPSVCRI